jgi:hypothetical protein
MFLDLTNVIHCVFRIKTINQVIRKDMNESVRILRYIPNCVLCRVSFFIDRESIKAYYIKQ